jgi:glutathione reductase (NADPH)
VTISRFDYDLFVIGAGSGGVRGSRIASSFGARVGICEESRVGGTCVIRGCVPKKMLVYASHFSEEFEDAAGFGWQLGERKFDWRTLIANKDREIDRLNSVYKQILSDNKVDLFESRGTLEDPHTIKLEGRTLTAEKILIATGGRPRRPEIPGCELSITSDEAFHLRELPKRVLITGGGYIAVEFAGIFNGMGASVTQMYRGPLILRGFDEDVRQTLEREMVNRGVDIRYQSVIASISRTQTGLLAVFSDGQQQEFDLILNAIGRVPHTRGLGLESAGVALADDGSVIVDEYSCSSVEHIHAVGDVTNRINLTPVALMEGECFARSVFGDQQSPVDHRWVASAVFSQPPVGTIGLSEADAREKYANIEVFRSSFTPLKHTITGRVEKSMLKLIVDAESRRVIGLHMVGSDAAEVVQGFAVAIKMGATKEQFDATIGIHPTAAEEFVTMRDPVS